MNNLTDIMKTKNTNIKNLATQTMGAKILSRKGNNPDYSIKFQNFF